MNIRKEQIKEVLKLDIITAYLKLMSIASIVMIIINIIVQRPDWYITIIIGIIFICAYKWRISFLEKQLKSYEIVFARLIKMNSEIFSKGTRKLTYSYEYDSHEYISTTIISDFFRDSHSNKVGDIIKIIVKTDNPKKNKVLRLKS